MTTRRAPPAARPRAAIPAEHALRRSLKTRHLALLSALAEHGSLRRAADALAISQPAATKTLSQLEALLGVPLFERQPRGLAFTAFGRVMTRRAQIVLHEIDSARAELAAVAAGATGKLAIGALIGAVPRLLSTALARLLDAQPRIEVSVLADTSATLLPLLQSGRLDIVVGRVPDETQLSGLAFEPLIDETIDVVARPDHPLLRAAPRPRAAGARRSNQAAMLTALSQQTWVMYPAGTILRSSVDAAFRNAGAMPPVRVIETPSTLLATALVQQTDMVAMLPGDVASHYEATRRVVRVPVPLRISAGALGIVDVGERPRAPVVDALIAQLRAVARELGS
ncbi:MAG TPA: LysR substrate-binding domain-containing protein [Burkholderiaceae bacterium]|nr:LysR substrate-binding domain-containing protein [Burkholderiaceae bacterium]